MVSVTSRPDTGTGEHERLDARARPRRGRNLEQLVAHWGDRDAALPVPVVVSIFDDVLRDSCEEEAPALSLTTPPSLADVMLDEHGVASLRGRSGRVSQISALLQQALGTPGEASIPLAVRGLLRLAESSEPPLEPAWFRAELRRTLGPPSSRAEVRALLEAPDVNREVASLIPAEALLDSTRPELVRPELEGGHATFIDPTRPAELESLSVLERVSEPPAPVKAPETLDLEPESETANSLTEPSPIEASLGEATEEAIQDEAPTERPSPASARPGAANWADSIQSSIPLANDEAAPELEPATELMTAASPLASSLASGDLPPSDSAFEVEAQTRLDLDEESGSGEGSRLDPSRPVVRLEPPRERPVSLTYAPAARLRGSNPPDEVPSRIRIPAEERGRAWAILLFSLVVGLVAAWALGYLP